MTRGMVISKEIDERKMDYRGSKSDNICKRATSGCFFIYNICKVRSSRHENGS